MTCVAPAPRSTREDFRGRCLRAGDAAGGVSGQLHEDGRPIRLGANPFGDRLGDDDGMRQRGKQVQVSVLAQQNQLGVADCAPADYPMRG
jgi:hypothetical protein